MDNDDSRPASPRQGYVPIIGFIAGDGAVTLTDPSWRPNPQPSSAEPAEAGEAG